MSPSPSVSGSVGAVVVVLVVVVAAGLVAGLVAVGACGVGAPVVVTGAGACDVGAAVPGAAQQRSDHDHGDDGPLRRGVDHREIPGAHRGRAGFERRAGDVGPIPSVTTMKAETSVWSTRASLDVEHVAHEIDVAGPPHQA